MGLQVELSEEHAFLQATMREFVTKELMPLEPEVGDGPLPPELRERLSEKTRSMGLWLLNTPKEWGGAGLDLLSQVIITEETARSITVKPRRPGIFGPELQSPLFDCNEAQLEKYVFPVIRGERTYGFAQTEVDAGSDPNNMRTTAVRSDDCYIINGAKHFISRFDVDFWIVVAVTDPEKRNRGGMSCFLVDADSPGVTKGRRWPMTMGDAPGDIYFDNVRVPAANLIGTEGQGFAQAQRHLTAARIVGHAARCVGMAQRALDMAMAFAPQRVTFGQPLSERQAIQFMIADSAIELYAARLMLYRCAQQWDQGQDVRNESYALKVVAAETCNRVVDRAIQIHGGMGLSKDLPLEYLYREARMYRITEGSMEVLRWRLVRNLFRERGVRIN